MRVIFKKIMLGFLGAALFLVALSGGAYCWLVSAKGLAFVEACVNGLVGVEVLGLQHKNNVFTLERLDFSDEDGVYFQVQKARLGLRILPLLVGDLSVSEITAQRISVIRPALQNEGAGDRESAQASPGFVGERALSLLRRVHVGFVDLPKIELLSAVVGVDTEFSVMGQLDAYMHKWERTRADLHVKRDGKEFAGISAGHKHFTFSFNDDGFVSSLADGQEQNVQAFGQIWMDGAGLWHGFVHGFVDEQPMLKANISSVKGGEVRIAGEALKGAPLFFDVKTNAFFERVYLSANYEKNMLIEGRVQRKGMRVRFEDIRVETPEVILKGQGFYSHYSSRLRANLEAQLAQPLSDYVQDVQGKPVLEATVRGRLVPLSFRVELEGGVRDFKSDNTQLQGVVGARPILKGLVLVQDEGVRLQSLRVQGQRLIAKASGWLHNFNALDFSYSLSAALPAPDDGRVDVQGKVGGVLEAINLMGDLQAHYDAFTAQLGYGLDGDSVKISNLELRGEGVLVKGAGEVELAKGDVQAGFDVMPEGMDVLRLNLKGAGWTQYELQGAMAGDLALNIDVFSDLAKAPMALRVKNLKVNTGGVDIAARKGFDIVYDEGGQGALELLGADFAVMGGEATVEAKVFLADMSGDSNVVFKGIGAANGKVPLGGRADFNVKNNALDGKIILQQKRGEVLQLDMQTDLRAGAPLKGGVKGLLDIGFLQAFEALDGHDVQGELSLDLTLSGVNTQPDVVGTLRLRQGRYDNVVYGTKLRELEGDVRFSGKQFVLERLEAKDGRKGRLSAKGQGNIDSEQAEITLALDKMHLASTGRLSVRLSGDGKVEIAPEHSRVWADMKVEGAEVYVSDMLGLGDAYSGFMVVQKGEAIKDLSVSKPMELDVQVRSTQGLFLRGPGLESEWSVDLHIGGTDESPEVVGEVAAIRGRYEFVDLMAHIQPSSRVVFVHGAAADNPELMVEADIRGNGHVAILQVEGTAQAPVVSIRSDEGKPADEALALVMFGEGKEALSAGQLLRVARVLAALSGKGGGFDPMNSIRRNIGLDTLSVGMGEDGEASLSAGKYVAEGVFVSVEQGTTPASSAFKTEIELTPSVRVETKVMQDDSSVGVQWRRDY